MGGSDPEWAFVVVMAESEDERRENDWTKSSPMGILLFLGFLFLHGFLWGGSGGKPKAAALLWSHLSRTCMGVGEERGERKVRVSQNISHFFSLEMSNLRLFFFN